MRYRLNKKIYLPLAVITVVVLYWLAVSPFSSENRKAPRINKIPVKVATAESRTLSRYFTALGTIQAARTVTVRSKVSGELLSLHFLEGQEVKQGELLAEIDPQSFEIELQQVEGRFSQDKAQLDNALRDLKRYQDLMKKKLVSQQEFDSKKALVEQLEGSIQVDQSAINKAKLQLSYTKITAPISGRVGLRRIDEGNYINANDSDGLVVITQTQPIDAIFTLPEREIPYLNQLGLEVEAWNGDNSLLIAKGKLVSIDNQIDPTTGTIKLKAQFDNQDSALFPNQFVNIKIKVAQVDSAITIPEAAVQKNNTHAFVWKVDSNGKVERVSVKTGLQQDSWIQIESGLDIGDRVITDGVDRVNSNSTVDVIPQG